MAVSRILSSFRRLRWKVAFSYTAVTVAVLLTLYEEFPIVWFQFNPIIPRGPVEVTGRSNRIRSLIRSNPQFNHNTSRVLVNLSDATGDYQIYTPQMIEEREVHEGDVLIIHTGYYHFGWDQPYADEIRYIVEHPGPDRGFAVWAKEKQIKWIAVDCGSADHPMITIIRDWMPRQAGEADQLVQEMYGATLAERFTPDEYQLMHFVMFPHHKADLPKTRFGDCYDPEHVERINRLTQRY